MMFIVHWSRTLYDGSILLAHCAGWRIGWYLQLRVRIQFSSTTHSSRDRLHTLQIFTTIRSVTWPGKFTVTNQPLDNRPRSGVECLSIHNSVNLCAPGTASRQLHRSRWLCSFGCTDEVAVLEISSTNAVMIW